VGVIIAFIFTWKMALITIGFSPFVFVGSILSTRIKQSLGNNKKQGEVDFYTASNALLSDIILNYRTVISFGEKNIHFLLDKYDVLLEEPNKMNVKNAHKSGFLYGYSEFSRFGFIAAVFYFGMLLIIKQGLTPIDTFTGIMVLFTSALGSG
jgi:ABC-type multidrug transport system fused ATPase/permease subunit